MEKTGFTNTLENKLATPLYFTILLFIAYCFSVGIRFIWVDFASSIEPFYYNNQLMINTNDGYFFAEGARDILAGGHQPNDLSPVDYPLAKLTALLATLLPFSFETLILYMPAFIGSLLVVPIMLIGRSLNLTVAGFSAALLASIAWSYYNRTMFGYYDTDMLVVIFPTLILWSMVFASLAQRNRFLLWIPFFMMLYTWWYSSSYSLNMGMTFMMAIYTALFERKNPHFYKILIVMLLALSGIFWWLKVAVILGLFGFFHFKKELINQKLIGILLLAAFLVVLFTGGFAPVLYQLKAYIFREALAADLSTHQLHYFAVNQTVREAGKIPFEIFANRISGHTVTFLFSCIGYLLLLKNHRVMWLSLPLVALGFIAYIGGLRFTVYAVPIMALGMGYLTVTVASLLFRDSLPLRYGFMALITAATLYPNIVHVVDYKVPTVFNRSEVEVLKELNRVAGREDYVISWWDYGYPIRYYSDVKTLVDGGKHTGDVNFPVSFILSHDQTSAANLARLDVEYTERAFHEHFPSNLIKMMEDSGTGDVNHFLENLSQPKLKLPAKSREVYFYLPDRMIQIFPTVMLFSNLDLATGTQYTRPFFYATGAYKDSGQEIFLGNDIVFKKDRSTLSIGKQTVPVKQLIVTSYNQKGNLIKQVYHGRTDGKLSIIFMQNYNRILVVDQSIFDSLFVQLYVLEQYNPALFEPVFLTPLAKVYKLKR